MCFAFCIPLNALRRTRDEKISDHAETSLSRRQNVTCTLFHAQVRVVDDKRLPRLQAGSQEGQLTPPRSQHI
jgi:hypothetical protein